MKGYTHLHVHTQYSILDGAAHIEKLFEKARDNNMKALAITDHGNMYGTLEFLNCAKAHGVKPIIGCEVYVAPDSRFEKKGKEDRSGFHLILLAKNKNGFHNLSKIVSLGFKEGFYYTPRIDKELLRFNSQDLIASTACLGGEIPSLIIDGKIPEAEKVILEYKEIFKDDFYIELMRHGLQDQDKVNPVLIDLAKKYSIKIIATNDVHFVNQEDFEAHKILICLNTNRDFNDPKALIYTGNEYFRTTAQMEELFADIPEAIENTQDIVDKIEQYELERKIILPVFPIPEGFDNGDEYLAFLTNEGAKKRYPEMTEEIKERLDFELEVIKKMGYAGYFLIVQDFINAARNMGVIVGPGRGSAAGSAVAFCVGITNIDPLKYNLLFERFLNPDRITNPDIDIDFDDEGRDKVLQYVIDKYGEDKVAQIITFGSMAAKSAIRDVARVLGLPLNEADKLAKLVPEAPGTTLKKAFKEIHDLYEAKHNGSDLVKKTLNLAEKLEGSVRHTGVHACGVIIGPDNLMEHIPLSISKDSKLMVTQYEGKSVESVGMLKMDFLGLKTLSIIKDTLNNIKKSRNIEIDINNIPLDDAKTFELFQQGKTIAVFQFESEGMRTYLRELKPTDIEDIIAMNALYRPGPMENIPIYINRKHGKSEIKYPHESIIDILKTTNGIMVYQEQIMQISQKMADFSKSKADELRKAMGKKDTAKIIKLKDEFVKGATNKGIEKEIADDIYESMARFGNYGFNRSHAAAYSVIAYQTAYLKAHYTAEFMAAVLTHNLNNIEDITFFIEESKRTDIKVLGPDINESDIKFIVNKHGEIRFGLGAIKNLGESAALAIISERETNGDYKDIFDLTSRINLRAVNKKSIESLACAGAFDSFPNTHRAQYFQKPGNDDSTIIDKALKFGIKLRESKTSVQQTLFGDLNLSEVSTPEIPDCEPWSIYELLKKEKEYIGFYISGHPLDEYKIDIDNFCNTTLNEIKQDLKKSLNKSLTFAGIVVESLEKTDKKDKKYGIFTLEDFSDSYKIYIFQEKYLKYKYLLEPGLKIFIQATVIPRFKDSTDVMLDIKNISLLSDVRNVSLKSITLKLDLINIDSEIINKIDSISKTYKGNCQLKFTILDKENNLTLNLFSDKLSVNPSNEFFDLISDINHLKYKLN